MKPPWSNDSLRAVLTSIFFHSKPSSPVETCFRRCRFSRDVSFASIEADEGIEISWPQEFDSDEENEVERSSSTEVERLEYSPNIRCPLTLSDQILAR